MEKHPVFVYGSLLHGLHNYGRYLAGATAHEEAAMADGFEMYSVRGSFPGIIPGGGSIHGELMFIEPDQFTHVMERLDHLEGYEPRRESHSFYLRREVTAISQSGSRVKAWIYLYNESTARLAKVPHGDWKEYLQTSASVR